MAKPHSSWYRVIGALLLVMVTALALNAWDAFGSERWSTALTTFLVSVGVTTVGLLYIIFAQRVRSAEDHKPNDG